MFKLKNKRSSFSITEILEHPIYSCEAPFGILFNKTVGSGWINGDWGLFGGEISGSFHLSNELKEYYIVKYLDDENLKTIKFDATRVGKPPDTVDSIFLPYLKAVKLDGKSILEEERQTYYVKNPSEKEVKSVGNYDRSWVIHLPPLPEPDYKTTTNFVNFQSSAPTANKEMKE